MPERVVPRAPTEGRSRLLSPRPCEEEGPTKSDRSYFTSPEHGGGNAGA